MTIAPDEDDFTELVDFHPDRVDLVGKAANGMRFLIAKQDASVGLLEPEFVRSLIGKSGPQDTTTGGYVPDSTATRERERFVTPNGLTLTGSPGDIASFIHKAAIAARDREGAGGADGFRLATAYVKAVPDTGELAEQHRADVAKAVAEYEQIVKAKYSAGDKRKMAASGEAMDDGSYPVKDEADLDHAIKAVGRGGADHDAIRRHVIKRAKALGKSSEIPGNWNADGSLKQPVSKEEEPPVTAVAKDLMDAAGDAAPLDDGIDGLDPTVPLAAPDDPDVPGDPTDPGSPAWEAIDAATACKWTAILARAGYAIGLLAEREMLEAASADPDDQENAWDLQDVGCALDYAISVLAPYAVGEQSEADCGAMEMEGIAKAAGFVRPADLKVIETFAAVKKAGRVLSAPNEAAIRGAVDSLQKVLASLPDAPVAKSQKEAGMPAAKTAGEAPAAPVAKEGAAAAAPEEQARNTGPVNAGGTTGTGQPRATGPDAALPGDGPQAALPGDAAGRTVVKSALQVVVYDRAGRQCITSQDVIRTSIAKADGGSSGDTLTAVFDQDGDLIGVVPASAIQPVAGAGAPDPGDTQDAPDPAAQAADPDDMEPQPSADAGTPASAVGKSARSPEEATMENILKGIADAQAAFAAQQAQYLEAVTKAVTAGSDAQAREIEVLKARVANVEEQPAVPGVFSNGATPPRDAAPPPAPQFRGQDHGGASQVDVAKALARKRELYEAPDARRQDQIAKSMQGDAAAALAAVHAAGPRKL